ncbi:hypothetical protein NHX12_000308, partial [Muraenolepis orangiensis]
VLTLHRGQFTAAGGRSSPVPQLRCTGGSAGCGAVVPEAVQCTNKGWDGVDVQWECKTDLDNSYQFGRIEVSCEGYSHPEDAFVLKGSCGLEYTLELTEEGRARRRSSSFSHHGSSKQSGGFGEFASNFFSAFSGDNNNNKQQQHPHHHGNQQHHQGSSSDGSGGLVVVGVLLLLAFGVYKLFLSRNSAQDGGGHRRQGGQPDDGRGYHRDDDNDGAPPPPPGFKPSFNAYPGAPPPPYGFQSDYSGGGGSGRRQYPRQHNNNIGGMPGGGANFWTGLGTGGVLGYLFGGQRNRPHGYHSNHSSFSASSHIPPPAPSPGFSSGSRTAAGFGGTKRR